MNQSTNPSTVEPISNEGEINNHPMSLSSSAQIKLDFSEILALPQDSEKFRRLCIYLVENQAQSFNQFANYLRLLLQELVKNYMFDELQIWMMKYLNILTKYVSKFLKQPEDTEQFREMNNELLKTLEVQCMIKKKKKFADSKDSDDDWTFLRKLKQNEAVFNFSLLEGGISLLKDNVAFYEYIFGKLIAQININLEYLFWQLEKPESLKYIAAALETFKTRITSASKETFIHSVLSGRFDKNEYGLSNTMILGDEGDLYILLNSTNHANLADDVIIKILNESGVTSKFLEDKIKLSKRKDTQAEYYKILLGKGSFGKVKFALNLFSRGPDKLKPGDLICVKKTYSMKELQRSKDFTTRSPMAQVVDSTISDYVPVSGNAIAKLVYSPKVLDMAIISDKIYTAVHIKGYLMMEVVPQNTGTKIFLDRMSTEYHDWEFYQKSYILDVFQKTLTLLEMNIAMTDLKPDNTLYNTDKRTATIIDLGGTLNIAASLQSLSLGKGPGSFQYTRAFAAPELMMLSESVETFDFFAAMAFSCGKILDVVIEISKERNQYYDDLKKISNSMLNKDPQNRLSIKDAISKIKLIGDDSNLNALMINQYINKIKQRIIDSRTSISLNEDIFIVEKYFIDQFVSDSGDSNNSELKNLSNVIDDFIRSHEIPKEKSNQETLQVQKYFSSMLIQGNAGSGKSLALQLKFIQAIINWKTGDPIPIYFNLANNINIELILSSLDENIGLNFVGLLSQKQSEDNKKSPNLKLHLYVDSFDEGVYNNDKEKANLIRNYFDAFTFSCSEVKIIITCRLGYQIHDSWYTYSSSTKEINSTYKSYTIMPIDYNQHQNLFSFVEKYISAMEIQNCSYPLTFEQSCQKIEEFNLKKHINTGLMFQMIMKSLPSISSKKISLEDIYRNYIEITLRENISSAPPIMKDRLVQDFVEGSLDKAGLENIRINHMALFLAGILHTKNDYRLKITNATGDTLDSELFTKLGYDISLSFKNQRIYCLLKMLPLKIEFRAFNKSSTQEKSSKIIEEVAIGFIQDTIKNFYLFQAVRAEYQNGRPLSPSLILGAKNIQNDQELLRFFTTAIENGDSELEQYLLYQVELSKKFKCVDYSYSDEEKLTIVSAANSMRILVLLNHNFNEADLAGVKLLGVNLSNASFFNTNFDGADLIDCSFQNTKIVSCSFNEATFNGFIFEDYGKLDYPTKSIVFRMKSDTVIRMINGEAERVTEIELWSGRMKEIHKKREIGGKKKIASNFKYCFLVDNLIVLKIATEGIIHDISIEKMKNFSFRFSSNLEDSTTYFGYITYSQLKIYQIDQNDQAKLEFSIVISDIVSFEFSPTGKYILAFTESKIFIIQSGKVIFQQPISSDIGIFDKGFDISDDESMLAYWDNKICHIIGVSTNKLLGIIEEDAIMQTCFSMDNRMIAIQTKNDIQLWDLSEFTKKGEYPHSYSSKFYTSDERYLRFLNEKYHVVSKTESGYTFIYSIIDLFAKNVIGTFKSVEFMITRDHKYFITRNDLKFNIWDTNTLALVKSTKAICDQVIAIALHPSKKELVISYDNLRCKVINYETEKDLFLITKHQGIINSARYSSDGKVIATCSDDSSIKLWDSSSGIELKTIKGNSAVTCIQYAPSGNKIAASYKSGIAIIWDAQNGENIITLEGHKGQVEYLAFSPNGKHLATASSDETAKTWSIIMGTELFTFKGHTNRLTCVNYSADGSKIITTSEDSQCIIWNLNTGEKEKKIEKFPWIFNQAEFLTNGEAMYCTSQGELYFKSSLMHIYGISTFSKRISSEQEVIAYGDCQGNLRIQINGKLQSIISYKDFSTVERSTSSTVFTLQEYLLKRNGFKSTYYRSLEYYRPNRNLNQDVIIEMLSKRFLSKLFKNDTTKETKDGSKVKENGKTPSISHKSTCCNIY